MRKRRERVDGDQTQPVRQQPCRADKPQTFADVEKRNEAGTAARIVVMIESEDEHDVWGTVGASENIIEASWIALVDAIEYKLYKDEAKGGVER